MQWTPEAEDAVKKVPFFVRKKVRTRVEEQTRQKGGTVVTLNEVEEARQRFLSGMAKEVKGYRLETCFAASGCPNRIEVDGQLPERIERTLQEADLLSFLQAHVKGGLKFHHEFRVTLADCPNACSQPQIKDIGIIAACLPKITEQDCSDCRACEHACREAALVFDGEASGPRLAADRCLACGRCTAVCPTGTLAEKTRGYRVQLGGKLGRHPRLARELPGIYSGDSVLSILSACLVLYKSKSRGGERFAEILGEGDFAELSRRFAAERIDGPPSA